MKKKILLIVVIALAIIGGAGFISYQKQQEKILINEVNKVSSLDITQDEIDMNIQSSGKYGVVEKKIKEYLNEYAICLKEVGNLMEDPQFANVLTVENYQADGPEFTKTKEYINSTEKKFNDNMKKLTEMTSEEAIMKYIESENLSQKYVDLYRDMMFDDEILKDLQETKSILEKTSGMINEVIQIQKSAIDLLANNKDKWVIESDELQFTSRTVLQQYNDLVEKLSTIE